MTRYLLMLTFFFVIVFHGRAQSRFGIEFRISSVKTENIGSICCGGGFETFYDVTMEEDLVVDCYSVGVVYKLNERSLAKLHFGKHRNGRITDLTIHDAFIGHSTNSDIINQFEYLQLAPSFEYRVINKRILIPFEIGINLNKRIREQDAFYISVKEYNFDYEINTGLQYRFVPQFFMSLRGTYTHYISEYQYETVFGSFKPQQYGWEFSMVYML